MINAEWPLRPIGDLFEITAGKMLNAASRGEGVKTPFLRTSNVLWDEIDLEKVDEMVIPAEQLAGKQLRAGDLLVCEGGEIGRAAIWNGERGLVSFQNHVHRLRPRVATVEPRFYVYFLQSAFTQLGIFEGAGNKTTIPNLSLGRLAQLQVPLPPQDEQRAVVKALAHVRVSLKEHERASSGAAELKRAMMKALFTRGSRGETQKETPMGMLPESWEVVSFETAFSIAQGQVDPRDEPYASMPHVGPEDVEVGSGRLLTSRSARDLGLISGKYLFTTDDIVYSKIRPYLNKVVMPHFDGLCSADMYPLRPRSGFLRAFLFQYLLTEAFVAQAVPHQLRTGIPKVNREQLAGVGVPRPTLEEQAEIADALLDIDKQIGLHHRKRTLLDELFRGLLYSLMTGEVRVTDFNLDALADSVSSEESSA